MSGHSGRRLKEQEAFLAKGRASRKLLLLQGLGETSRLHWCKSAVAPEQKIGKRKPINIMTFRGHLLFLIATIRKRAEYGFGSTVSNTELSEFFGAH